MSTSVASVISHFPTAQNGFTTTTAGSVASGATTVTLNSVAGYTNGEPAVFVIDPTDASKKQTFTGIIDTSGVQITSVVWTAGTNTTHALGATVVDYATATHIAMLSKGMKVSHNQDGTLKTGIVATAMLADSAVTAVKIASGVITPSKFDTNTTNGWYPITGSISAVTANGNRSYSLTTGSDNSASLSPGMRLRSTRTVAAPTQCASLNGTTNYFSKSSPTGMAQTDNITLMGWVKPTSYALSAVMSRANGTTDGWTLAYLADGRVQLYGNRAADDNVFSNQSLPLNKWTHLAISMNSSGTTGAVYFDGVLVPSQYTNNGNTGFATPTADFRIGAGTGGTLFFPGKIAQAAVFSAVLSASTIRSYMSQGLAGTETSLVSAYSFNNSITDLNANANTLTNNGTTSITNADSPFGGQAGGTIDANKDYAIIQTVSASTLVVQVPEGCTIPTSGGVSAVSYSSVKVPYGFPTQKDKWTLYTWLRTTQASTSNATFGSFMSGGYTITPGIGAWNVGQIYGAYTSSSVFSTLNLSPVSLTGLAATAGYDLSRLAWSIQSATNGSAYLINGIVQEPVVLSSATTYTLQTVGATTAVAIQGDVNQNCLFAENTYL